eukprot:scaffold396962_cov20-Prasinocladus_malaysianus.AAC.1
MRNSPKSIRVRMGYSYNLEIRYAESIDLCTRTQTRTRIRKDPWPHLRCWRFLNFHPRTRTVPGLGGYPYYPGSHKGYPTEFWVPDPTWHHLILPAPGHTNLARSITN